MGKEKRGYSDSGSRKYCTVQCWHRHNKGQPKKMSDDEEISQEELNREILECARYGEAEDLSVLLSAGAMVDHRDSCGNSAMHKGE